MKKINLFNNLEMNLKKQMNYIIIKSKSPSFKRILNQGHLIQIIKGTRFNKCNSKINFWDRVVKNKMLKWFKSKLSMKICKINYLNHI